MMEEQKIVEKLGELEGLLKEQSTPSNQPVPESLRAVILYFKEAYIETRGRLPPRGLKGIIVLLMAHGAEGLKAEADKMREDGIIFE